MAGKIAWECLHKVFLTVAGKCNWVEIVLSKQIGPHLLVCIDQSVHPLNGCLSIHLLSIHPFLMSIHPSLHLSIYLYHLSIDLVKYVGLV